jgi:acetylglutamate synthase
VTTALSAQVRFEGKVTSRRAPLKGRARARVPDFTNVVRTPSFPPLLHSQALLGLHTLGRLTVSDVDAIFKNKSSYAAAEGERATALANWLAGPEGEGAGGGAAPAADKALGERSLITQLLGHFKQTSEVRQYLKYYGRVDSDRFAVVKISGDVLSSAADTARVASALAFLHRIGLVPIVVHGAGIFTGRQPAAVAAAAAAGASPASVMSAAVAYMTEANGRLVEALAKEGVQATPLTGGVFSARAAATAPAPELEGVAGVIEAVDSDTIAAAISRGSIPIVAAIGTSSPSSAAFTFSTHDAALAIAGHVQPLKVIWLRPEGGLKTSAGSTVAAVDLARDAPHLVRGLTDVASESSFDSGSSATVGESSAEAQAEVVREQLDLCGPDAASLVELATFHAVLSEPGATVSVTDPEHLAEELFSLSHKGKGTLIARGERILAHSSFATLDVPRLQGLIEAAFGATLPEGYMAELATSGRIKRVYVSEHYRAAAVVLALPGAGPQLSYLDKFAVDPSAQGDKLGETLWRAMVAREPHLFWRSRSSNKVNPWYYEQSHGCLKAPKSKSPSGDWTVFWRGVAEEDVMTCVDLALSLPATFAKGAGAGHADGAATGASCTPLLK